MEEDFWTEEAFVANIDREWLFGDGILRVIAFDIFAGVSVVLVEFLGDIGTNIAKSLLCEKCNV